MSKVHLIPVGVFLIFQTTFIGTYIAAVLQGHVVPNIPYISDAATYSPESCVFGQLINLGSVLLGITIYVRYRHILELFQHRNNLNVDLVRYNRLSLWFGIASCFGISVVGNFQETNVRIVHLVGAFCCFGFGSLYFWMQSLVSYMILLPNTTAKLFARLRLAMAVCCTILFILMAVTGIMSHVLYHGENPRKWYPSDGGWHYHLISSISEWIMATVFCFYILTFTPEFRNINFDHPPISLVSHVENIL